MGKEDQMRMRTLVLAACLTTGSSAVTWAQDSRGLEWAGRYANGAEGGGELTISRDQGGHRVTAEVAVPRCVGRFEGRATLRGGVLTARQDRDGQSCTLTIRSSGDSLQVGETGCLTFHGAACSFEGTYRRQDR
jgi:hypothetical protein